MHSLEKIILIDDDPTEFQLLGKAILWLDLDFELIYFSKSAQALEYITNTKDNIFLTICDIEMPKMDGLALHREIDCHAKNRKKTIPFIFFSNLAEPSQIMEAYDNNIQGYFRKPMTFEDTIATFDIIVRYWKKCRHPFGEYTGFLK